MGFPAIAIRLFRHTSDNIAIQAFRFAVVGAVAFAVDFALLIIAVNVWDWNYLISAALGYTVGLIVNYCLCVRWVFSQRRFENRKPEFLLFALIGITGLGLTELVLWAGTDLLGMDLRLSKAVAVFAVAIWNFTLRKTFLFSHRIFGSERGLKMLKQSP